MSEYIGPNPYDHFSKTRQATYAMLEIPQTVSRLKKAFEQRKGIGIPEGEQWLETVRQTLHVPNVFFGENSPAKITKRLSPGFFSTGFVFESETGKWVLKVGTELSPVPAYFNPSSEEYTAWYRRNLSILIYSFAPSLPYLIPQPQEVLFAKKEHLQTSLIIQPYVENAFSFDMLSQLSWEEKQNIRDELIIFDRLSHLLYQEHGLVADILGGEGNFVIAGINGGYHIVLLDNGLIDLHAPSPIYNTINKAKYAFKMAREKRRLERELHAKKPRVGL